MATQYKPILFSTEMVQAILEGRKIQTRRIIKPQPEQSNVILDGIKQNIFMLKDCATPKGWLQHKLHNFKIGDILWVRETWKAGAWNEEFEKIAFDYAASPELKKTPWVEYQYSNRFEEILLKIIDELDKLGIEPSIIDEENEKFYYKWEPGDSPLKWKPSIYMPKEAARIFLEVTNIRVERLRNISEEDAIAEGIERVSIAPFVHRFKNYLCNNKFIGPKESFKTLWMKINGIDSWKSNPWVWVYEFKVVEKPKDFTNEH